MLPNQNFSTNTLTLLETAAQADWWAKQINRGSVLAITPEAAYTCQKLGQSYLKLEDYAQVLKRSTEYTSIHEYYLEWETWLDDWAQRAVPEFGIAGFKPASNAALSLNTLFQEIWATTVSLCELIETIQPERVALWPPNIIDVPWYLHPSVSSLPALLPAIARAHGIDMIDLSTQAPEMTPISKEVKTYSNPKQLIPYLKSQLRQIPIMTDWVQSGLEGLLPHLKLSSTKAPRILFSGYTYDLSPLARALRRRGARVTILSDALSSTRLTAQSSLLPDTLQSAITTAGERLWQEPKLWEPLEQWGLDHTPLWIKPIHFWWHQLVPEFWLNYQHVQQLLERHKFSAMVTWDTTGNSLSSAAANAAATAKVPRYIYQHGSSSGVSSINWYMYLQQSETFLVYGQGTANELRQTYPPFLKPDTQIIPVGSSRLDLLRQQRQQGKISRLRHQLQAGDTRPIIMYIPTCFSIYGRAVSSELAAYPDISYFELQQTILKLWREAPAVRLLYKEFIIANDPNRVMPDFIKTHIPDAIITNQRLTDLMWVVDAIIVDHVITAINEVLLTNKPLVIYMPPPNASHPLAKNMLRKRATVAETPAEFIEQVRRLLQAGSYSELETPDTEFLQAYGTHLNDGRSAERAASVILQEGKLKG